MMIWRGVIIWLICAGLVIPLPQAVPITCELSLINPPNQQESVIFGTFQRLPNDNLLYVSHGEDVEKLWLVTTDNAVHYLADVDIYYSMVPEIRIYRDERFIYLSQDEQTETISVEQIDLHTYAHKMLFEHVYQAYIYLRGDWLFVPTAPQKTTALNLQTEFQVNLEFPNVGGRGSVDPLAKITESQWLFSKDNTIFVVDLTTASVLALAMNAIAASYLAPQYAIFDDRLIYFDRNPNALILQPLDGSASQEITLQGPGDYKYLQATERGIIYTYESTLTGRQLYFVDLAGQNDIIHLNADTAELSRFRLATAPRESTEPSSVWYQTTTAGMYRAELIPPFPQEHISNHEVKSSIQIEHGQITYFSDEGYVLVSSDGQHIKNIGTDWGYAMTDEEVFYRKNEDGTILRYNYLTDTVQELSVLEGSEVRLYPVKGQNFLYFQSDDRVGILSFDGAVSLANGQIRYLNEYPVGQDPHWGNVRYLPDGSFVFASNHNKVLTHVHCSQIASN